MSDPQDVKRHAEGWNGFVKFITYSVIAAASSLILMAIFLLP